MFDIVGVLGSGLIMKSVELVSKTCLADEFKSSHGKPVEKIDFLRFILYVLNENGS